MSLDILYGALNLDFWRYVLAAFVMVQFTFMAVTRRRESKWIWTLYAQFLSTRCMY